MISKCTLVEGYQECVQDFGEERIFEKSSWKNKEMEILYQYKGQG
jgi:hypothetical protein